MSTGFNVENYIHKGYHAEEVALIHSLLERNIKKEDYKGIVICYDFKHGNEKIYPACAFCRQILWEFTNPNLLVTVIDLHGKIRMEKKLKNLYPHPYP